MWPSAAASPELVSSWLRPEAEEPQNVWRGSVKVSTALTSESEISEYSGLCEVLYIK